MIKKRMTKEIGDQAEQRGKKYLLQQGLTFITENFTTKLGEIDLIMRDKYNIIFVEVKYRSTNRFGEAAEFVTPSKQKKIIFAAQEFMQKKNWMNRYAMRFDVLGINSSHINWIQNAF